MTSAHEEKGQNITFVNGKLLVPSQPVIGFIEGDGTGPDIWKAAKVVLDAAVKNASSGSKRIIWKELLAGEKAYKEKGHWLPDETIDEIKSLIVAIKGPLTTPVGGGFRSVNVALRQVLDLYACIRPVKYIKGVPSPMKYPEKVNMVIFRENTEDVYAGIEWPEGSEEAKKLTSFLKNEFAIEVPEDSGMGIKPISRRKTYRLVRKAIEYALENRCSSVTIVHKGNIMKYTEGAFRKWGYELAKKEFEGLTISEEELLTLYQGERPDNKIIIKDRIADAMFQQVLLRPEEYSVIATPNLNGDYLSDALAAQVGGLGMAPGANIGDSCAIFEATHGTAPKYAGLDKVNPSSLILSGAMMFRYLGWHKEATMVEEALERAVISKKVTYDLARQMEKAEEVSCSRFAEVIVDMM